MGGSDEPSNLIELSIKEHSEAHKVLFEKYGHWQDYVAWKGLDGLISKEEIMKIMYLERTGEKNPMYGKPCYYKMTEEQKLAWKKKISETMKGRPKSEEWKKKQNRKGENNPMFGKEPWNKGKKGLQPKSEESKKKISKPVLYNGVEYYGVKDAARQNNTTDYHIRKTCVYL